ncbi:hypothetical protein GCM10027194_03770 [Thalassiella azotivora]
MRPLHHHGVVAQQLAAVDEHPVGDLGEHGRLPLPLCEAPEMLPAAGRPRGRTRELFFTYIGLDSRTRRSHAGPVHAFDVLGDRVRRRILELLADGELPAGEITAVVHPASAPTAPSRPA